MLPAFSIPTPLFSRCKQPKPVFSISGKDFTYNAMDPLFHQHKNIFTMGNLLYLIAVILVIAWAVGFLGYHATGLIHILLVIAVIAVLLRVIRGAS
jgi:predicted ferric reductase